MIRKLFPAIALLVLGGFAQAQLTPANSPIQISRIDISLEKSPEFNIGVGPQRKAVSQDWLWVEVSYTYNPKAPNAPSLDDVEVAYYILLNNASKPANPLGTLLSGKITHTGVTPGSDIHHSVALVSPQTLRRYFDGKAPTAVATVTQAIGVTITIQGQLAAEMSVGKGKGKPQWWVAPPFQRADGFVLSKDQTPFAPLFYDYFDAVKSKSGN